MKAMLNRFYVYVGWRRLASAEWTVRVGVSVEELRQVGWGHVMEGFVGQEKEFEMSLFTLLEFCLKMSQSWANL